MRGSGLLLFFTLALFSPGVGDEASPNGLKRWNLEECLGFAMENNAEIREARRGLEAAQGQRGQARAAYFPQMSVTTLLGPSPRARGDAVFSPDTDNLSGLDFGKISFFTKTDLTITQPLFTFGKLRGFSRAASRGVRVEEARIEEVRQRVSLQVKEAYYGLLLASGLKSVAEEIEGELTEALAKGEKLLKSRKISRKDLLKLKVFLSEVKKGSAELRKSHALAARALALRMGTTQGIEPSLESLIEERVEVLPLEEYLALVENHRPEWRQIEEGIQAKKSLASAEKADFFPTFFLAGGVRHARAPNRADQKNPFVRDDFNFFEGGAVFGAKWNLSWGMTAARVSQAKAETAKLEEKRVFAKQGFALEVEKAFLEIREAKENIVLAKEALKAGRGLLFMAGLNYGVGVSGGEDLLEALGAFGGAQKNYHEALFKMNMACAALSRACGIEITDLKY